MSALAATSPLDAVPTGCGLAPRRRGSRWRCASWEFRSGGHGTVAQCCCPAAGCTSPLLRDAAQLRTESRARGCDGPRRRGARRHVGPTERCRDRLDRALGAHQPPAFTWSGAPRGIRDLRLGGPQAGHDFTRRDRRNRPRHGDAGRHRAGARADHPSGVAAPTSDRTSKPTTSADVRALALTMPASTLS